jgi:hypothetical protein
MVIPSFWLERAREQRKEAGGETCFIGTGFCLILRAGLM